ncbi:aspartate ammonia-lyase [Candidatus Uhrbacteria bacterium]|nr:aspartate ammonia-lyase [Candidatus Uhrbacteria bacterium]
MKKQYFGTQTTKAIKNFPFTFRRTPKVFLYTIVEIKKAAALAHFEVAELDRGRKTAVVQACDEILRGKLDAQFVLPAFQGGAGTSNHMNVNEVIANRATEILSGKKKTDVHPNNHVNMSHSTNDVMPSALKIVALRLSEKLLLTLDALARTFDKKADEFATVTKLGRTHMQDAVPITLGDEFASYAEYIRRGSARIAHAREELRELNLGGSAVGNSLNASGRYRKLLYRHLKKITKINIRPAKNLMARTSSDTDFVALSQALAALCVDLSKIANDLRVLSSGPRGGFGEISLPELQAGSSMMPGKVNPILPEAVNQLYFLVSGNNVAIEKAAEAAQLELGAMLPLITDRLIESLTLIEEVVSVFRARCVAGIRANRARMQGHLEKSTSYATLLSPQIGYQTAADAVKQAIAENKPLRSVITERKILTEKQFDQLTRPQKQ